MFLPAVALLSSLSNYAQGIEQLRRANAGDAAAADGAVRLLEAATHDDVRSRSVLRYYLAQAQVAAGRKTSALANFDALARGSSIVAKRARWDAADLVWDLGRTRDARKRYLDALKLAPQKGDRARALFRAGALKQLAIEEPDHPLAAKVFSKLTLTVAERLARGKRLIDRLRFDAAARELDNIPGAQARYHAGLARYRSRHAYAEASKILLDVYPKLPRELAADALFHGARALSRIDRDDDAIRLYGDVVRRYPKSAEAAEAAYLRGWLEYNRSKYAAALQPLEDAARAYPKSKWGYEARWIRAWSLFLLKRNEDALAAFAALEGKAPQGRGDDDELGLPKLLYWKAHTLKRLSRGPEAEQIWRDIAQRFPLSWYGLLARQQVAATVTRIEAAAPAPGRLLTKSTNSPSGLASDSLLLLADELIAVGLPDEARRELRRGEKAYRGRWKQAGLPALLDRYRLADDWRRVYALGDSAGGALRQPLTESNRWIWHAAYPLAYRALVERHGPPAGNPDHYLYAIMRKESAFDPREQSIADARGLLQMIPATSRRVAERIGIPYEEETLFDPEKNIRLGAWYIGRLFKKFQQQVPLAAASYNAGPKPVMRWCDQQGTRPMDEFVERIPYNETREYAKKVTGIYARYRYLYANETYRIPERVNCKYVVDEIDY